MLNDLPEEGITWLMLGMVSRYLQLPQDEVNAFINKADMQAICDLLYETFERWAGKESCTPNIHSVFHHAHEIRLLMDGVQSSAAPFESFFSLTKRMNYAPGGSTRGAVRNHLLLGKTADAGKHKCAKGMKTKFSTDSAKYSSNHVYKFCKEKRIRRLYELAGEPDGNGMVICRELHVVDFVDPLYKINVGPFGVYKYEYTNGETVSMKYADFDGRAVSRNLKWREGSNEQRPIYFTLSNLWLNAYT